MGKFIEINRVRDFNLGLVVLIGSTFSIDTVAQGAESLALEEVIVTAQKRSQSAQDVPSTIASISEDLLTNSNTTEFGDLGKLVSGLVVSGPANGEYPTVRIRGVGSNRYTPTIRSSATVFVNEVPLPVLDAAFNNLADVQRIEVLKGPQSTLFGAGVSSGAISIVTNRPNVDEIEGLVDINIGENNLREYRGVINVPLSARMALRGSLYHTGSDGEIKNIRDGSEGDTDAVGGRLDFLFEPSDNVTLTLGYEKHEKEAEDMYLEHAEYGEFTAQFQEYYGTELPPEDPFDGKIYSEGTRDTSSDIELWSGRIEWDINDTWSLTSITAYQDFEFDLDTVSTYHSPYPFVIVGSSDLGPISKLEFLTQEFRLSYESENLSSLLGLYYSNEDRDAYIDVATAVGVSPPGIFYLALSSQQESETEATSVYTHNVYSFNERFDLVFGLRYEETDIEIYSGTPYGHGQFADDHAFFFVTSTWDIPKQSGDWSAVSGTLKLKSHITDTATVYAGYDRGVKTGGFNGARAVSALAFPDQYILDDPFDEQVADNYEIGLKSVWNDGRLRLNASVFYQEYDDFQVEVPDEVNGIGNVILNAASLVSKGAELDFAWVATTKLLIDGSVSFVDAEWDKFENAPCNAQQLLGIASGCVDGVQDLSGEPFHGNGEWSSNLNATWTSSFANGLEWQVRGELVYRDDFIGLPDHDARTFEDSYTLFNASFALMGEAWSATLWGKNLTDEEYAVLYERSGDGLITDGNYGMNLVPNQGKAIGVRFRYQF